MAADRASWRSEALGPARALELRQGRLHAHVTGEGPAIVFVHGVLVNGDLWRKVVPELSKDFRCIAPDLPLGSHSRPLAPDASRTSTSTVGFPRESRIWRA